jgi:hypothetical protein
MEAATGEQQQYGRAQTHAASIHIITVRDFDNKRLFDCQPDHATLALITSVLRFAAIQSEPQMIRIVKVAATWAVYLLLALVGYLIAWWDRLIGFPLSFPRDIAALAKREKWCLRTLQESRALPDGAKVHRYKVTPIRQELVFRSSAGFVEIDYSHGGARRTLTCFAKFAPTMGSIWSRTIFNMQLNHLKEAFFNSYFAQVDEGVPAPKVYCAKVAVISGNLCLMTEQMTDGVEYREWEDLPPHHLQLALDGLAALHARYWRATARRMSKILPISDSTVFWFDSLVAFSWSAAARAILVQSWRRMNEAETVLHGDARVGNMIFPAAEGRGRFVLIDWQATRKGKAAFDLAYFLVLSLSTGKRVAIERDAIDHYHERLTYKGVTDYSKETLAEDYRHACLCILILLSLPMLSGEASVEGEGARVFARGMNLWRERLQAKFADFDYQWMATRYGIREADGRDAIAQILGVIARRLQRITGEALPQS